MNSLSDIEHIVLVFIKKRKEGRICSAISTKKVKDGGKFLEQSIFIYGIDFPNMSVHWALGTPVTYSYEVRLKNNSYTYLFFCSPQVYHPIGGVVEQ